MADKTGIAWTQATWNPLVGCSIVSSGCAGCYAMREAGTRLASHPKYRGLTLGSKAGPVWTGEVRLWEAALDQPLRWKSPRMIFVNSMSDLFHESVPDEWLERIFSVMAHAGWHTYQLLTKRPARMRDYVRKYWSDNAQDMPDNWWFGVSCEDQSRADERIPVLLDTPAAVRWVSAEPLLGPIDLWNLRGGTFDAITGCGDRERLDEWEPTPRLDWIVVGGESGPGSRPMELSWAYSIVQQCTAAQVPCFVKQMGGNAISTGAAGADPDGVYRYRYRDRKGGDWSEWLPELRVREYPAQERA